MTCTIGGLESSTLCAWRLCHVSASPHQWPAQELCPVNHKLTDQGCMPKGTRQPFSGPGHLRITGFVHLWMRHGRTYVYVKLFNKRKLDRETCRAKWICSPGCVMCRRWKMKGFTHINPINCSNKEIPSSPSQMWVMQTFAAVYGTIIIYSTSKAALADCLSFVQPQLYSGGISEEEKSQCHAVRRHFSQTKICVSTFCQGVRGQRSELLASFSEESRGLMGLLFHSICRPPSHRPQLHTCEPATVTLHTSLQPASSTLPLTADTSCSSSDTRLKN